MMDGEIGVQSQPRVGSTFWFMVKLPKASPAWLSRHVSLRLANLNVLVVDRNRTNAEIVVSYLAALGVHGVAVSSGYFPDSSACITPGNRRPLTSSSSTPMSAT